MRDPLDAFRRSPDEASFRSLYEATRGIAWALCRRVAASESAAEEAFQSTWCRLLRVAKHGDPRELEGDAIRCVGRIALREAGRLRKRVERRRKWERTLEEARGVIDPTLTAPDEIAERRELRATVETALAELPEDERLRVELRFVHGFSVREIAVALGEARSTVADRLQGTLHRLDRRFRERGLGEARATLANGAPLLAWLEPPVSWSPVRAFELAARAGSLSGTGASSAGAATTGEATASKGAVATLFGAGVSSMKFQLIAIAAVVITVVIAVFIGADPHPARSGLVTNARRENDAVLAPDSGRPPATAVRSAPEVAGGETTPIEEAEPTTATGSGTVYGRVLDAETGEPIVGALVRFEWHEGETTSDADGSYSIPVPPLTSGSVTIVASADGYETSASEVELAQDRASELELRLDPGVDVAIEVVERSGAPLADARIARPRFGVIGVYSDEGSVQTDERGRAIVEGASRLRPPQLSISKPGFVPQYVRVAIASDGSPEPLRVVLDDEIRRARVVEGRITDASGLPIGGARVEWKDPSGTSFGTGAVYGEPSVTSGGDGWYRLEVEQPEDTCHLGFAAQGFAPHISSSVGLGSPDSPSRHDVTLSRGFVLRGQVVDESGEPLEGAQLSAMPQLHLLHEAIAYPAVRRVATTDPAGAFEIIDAPGPRLAIRVTAPERPPLEIEVEASVDLRIVLDGYGMFRGRVVDAETGEPIQAFTAHMRGQGQRSDVAQNGLRFTAVDGRFAWKGLASDPPVSIRVEAEGYAPEVVDGVRASSLADAEENTFRLRPARFIDGVVIDGATGEPIAGVAVASTTRDDAASLLARGEWERFGHLWDFEATRSAPDGRFRLRDSTDGSDATILARAPGKRRVSIPPTERLAHLAQDGTIVVRMESAESIRGRVLDGLEPVAGRRVDIHAVDTRPTDGAGEDAFGRHYHDPYGSTELDAEGRFEFDDLSPGTYLIEIDQPARRVGPHVGARLRRLLIVEPGESSELEFGETRGETGTLQGTFAGTAERGAVFGEIVLRRLDEPSEDVHMTPTDIGREWRFAFPALAAGAYRADIRYACTGGDVRFTVERVEVAGDAVLEVSPPTE